MTGPKLNEGATIVGERSGTKATAKYVRSSATKARAVLDLIRDLDVVAADEVLQFTDRHIAHEVRKVLASAVANAINNDYHDAEELYVVACFADEGPTLRRFRPRARGRATRINKRTCHITIVLAPMSEERLEIVQARRERQGGAGASGRPQSSAASRRARVERSRQRAADEQPTVDDVQEAHDGAEVSESAAAPSDVAAEGSPSDEAGVEADQEGADSDASTTDSGAWPGSVEANDDGDAPEGYEIKGNTASMLFHTPDSRYYGATKADVWFDSVESAEAAGFSQPGDSTTETPTEEPTGDEADEAEDK